MKYLLLFFLMLLSGLSHAQNKHEHEPCCKSFLKSGLDSLNKKKFNGALKDFSECSELRPKCPDLEKYQEIAQKSIDSLSGKKKLPDPKPFQELKGISKEEQDKYLWDSVKDLLDPKKIQEEYIEACRVKGLPCLYSKEAEARIRKIDRDTELWVIAKSKDDTAAIKEYFSRCKQGGLLCIYQGEAEQLLDNLREKSEQAMWESVKNSGDPFRIRDEYLLKTSLKRYVKDAEKLINDIIASRKPRMVLIPGGTFEIGDVLNKKPDYENEKRHKNVEVRSFYMGTTEVTFDEYDAYCYAKKLPRVDDNNWGRGAHPVIHVEWYDAIEYCNWRSLVDGFKPVYTIDKETVPDLGDSDQKQWRVTADPNANGYRLPRELEWEYAAREGGKNVRFGNGQDMARDHQMNFKANHEYQIPYSIAGQYRERTVPVGSLKSPNGFGLHDMSGNVFEWCWEAYDEEVKSYKAFFEKNGTSFPTTPGKGRTRVARGGSWASGPDLCRTTYRYDWQPEAKQSDVGFRVVRNQ